MTQSLDDKRARSIGRLNARISAHINRELAARGGEQIDSPAQKAVLINLEERGNRATELATRLHISKQAVSQLVQELETKGLVRRAPDPADGRASLIVFTKRGRQVVADTLDYFAEFEALVAAELGEDQLEALRELMTSLAALIDPDGF